MIGAAQGLASIIGGVLGGFLAATGGFMLPLALILTIIMLLAVSFWFSNFLQILMLEMLSILNRLAFLINV